MFSNKTTNSWCKKQHIHCETYCCLKKTAHSLWKIGFPQQTSNFIVENMFFPPKTQIHCWKYCFLKNKNSTLIIKHVVFPKNSTFIMQNIVFPKKQQIHCGNYGFPKNSKIIVENMVFPKNQQTHCGNIVFPKQKANSL